MLGTKENREELLLMVPVVCDFSSWVLFSPLLVGSPPKSPSVGWILLTIFQYPISVKVCFPLADS